MDWIDTFRFVANMVDDGSGGGLALRVAGAYLKDALDVVWSFLFSTREAGERKHLAGSTGQNRARQWRPG